MKYIDVTVTSIFFNHIATRRELLVFADKKCIKYSLRKSILKVLNFR